MAPKPLPIEAAVRSDQKQTLSLLQTRFAAENYPHALLFKGQQGVGKRWTALALATAISCPNNANLCPSAKPTPLPNSLFGACGQCRSCHKAVDYQHPDLIQIRPQKGRTRIAAIRGLLKQLVLKPMESRRRVVVLEDAETLTPSAANALLKVLEEPPSGTVFILTSSNHHRLLPTIHSRCQQVPFRDLSRHTLEKTAADSLGLEPDEAAVAAGMAFGSLDRLQQRGQGPWLNRRRKVIQEMIKLAGATIAQRLGFAFQISKDRPAFEALLEILTGWYRDLLFCQYGIEHYLHSDMADLIDEQARHLSRSDLLNCLDCLGEIKRYLQSNLNLKLAGETLVLKLTRNLKVSTVLS